MSADWSVNAGYRYMHIDKDIDGTPTTLNLSGPMIGVSYHF